MISTPNQITNFPFKCERGNSYRTRLPQRVADSCHVIQQLIFMTLGQLREKHTQKEYQCSSLYSSISISAYECYNFIFTVLIDQFFHHSQMYIRKCNITALIFFEGLWMFGRGLISMEFQCKHNTPTRKERFELDEYSIWNVGNFPHKR